MISQEMLREELAQRIAAARSELAARLDLSSPDGLLAARREILQAAQDAKVLAICVLRSFDLPTWVRATCEFAGQIGPDAAAEWRRDFTRTVFLAGNPSNLVDRFALDHVTEDGSAAWQGPAPVGDSATLRRLLKLFDGSAELPASPPAVVRVGDGRAGEGRTPVGRDLYVATAGVTTADCLVHLNHLLAEAVLDGLIGPGDRLTVRQVPWLSGLAGPFAALRITDSPNRPTELRVYAALTEETHDD